MTGTVPPPPPGFRLVEPPAAPPPPPPGFRLVDPAAPAAGQEVIAEVNGGRVIRLPNGQLNFVSPGFSTNDQDRIQEIMAGAEGGMELTGGERATGAALDVVRPIGNFVRGLPGGFADLLGTPANAISAATMIPNLLPGEQGFRSITQRRAEEPEFDELMDTVAAIMGPAFGQPLVATRPAQTSEGMTVPLAGSENLRDIGGQGIEALFGSDFVGSPVFQPETRLDRFLGRVGEEVGYSALPLGIVARGLRQSATPVVREGAQRLIGNEVMAATGAGVGAQSLNELAEYLQILGATPDDEMVGSPTSDLTGSLVGSLGLPVAGGVVGGVRQWTTGSSGAVSDVARERIAGEFLDRSQEAQDFVRSGGDVRDFDTTSLADRLDTPTSVEQAVPGYRATVGERTGDIGLLGFEDRLSGGDPTAVTRRQLENTRAVNEAVDNLAPQGDPTAFQAAVQRSVDDRLARSSAEVGSAQRAFEEAVARLEVLEDAASPAVRGQAIRGGLAEAAEGELARVRELFQQIDQSDVPVDLTPLRQRFDALTESMFANDVDRFLPTEVGTVRDLTAEGADPVGPIGEATAIRSGLSSDVRSTTEPQRQNVARGFINEVDAYLDEIMPPELRGTYQEGVALRADVGRRFEEGGIGQVLNETGRGQFRMPDEAVPSRLVPSGANARNITDYRRVMQEAGDNPAVRGAIEDTIALRAARHFDNPEAMAQFVRDNNIVLSDFPDLRTRLEAAGASREALNAAQQASDELTRQIGPGGRAPEGRFLWSSGATRRENPVEAFRSILNNSTQPVEDVRTLLSTVGDNAEAVAGARAAFWQEIVRQGRSETAASRFGEPVWNARAARNALENPRFQEVAQELFGEEGMADLEVIRNIFTEMEAARPGQVRSPSNPSGTAASAGVQRGAQLTPARISADLRAVGQNRTSVAQVGIQWVADGLRNMTARRQEAWINELMENVAQEPGQLADILREYNPAVMAYANRNITGYRGIRGSQINALLEEVARSAGFEEEQDEDDQLIEAINGPDTPRARPPIGVGPQ